MKQIILTLILALLVMPNVIAVYDDDFRNCLTQKIYEDCDKNLIWTKETILFPNGSPVIKNGETLTKEKIRNIVDFSEIQNNDFKIIGVSVESYPERFYCNDYYLRVNDGRYYWRGVEVTCPTNITKEYFNDFTLFGFNIISNGGFTAIGFTLISLGGLTFIGIGFAITFVIIIKKKRVKIWNYIISVTKEKKPESPE
jgi:hypothetical protein